MQAETKVCAECGSEKPLTEFYRRGGRLSHLYQSECKDCKNGRDKRYRETYEDATNQERGRSWTMKLKEEVFAAYGGRCACTGCPEHEDPHLEFLHIDHVNGDGAAHRREIGVLTGRDFWRWLKREGYPDGFRILCANCNGAVRYGRVCPHMEKVPSLS